MRTEKSCHAWLIVRSAQFRPLNTLVNRWFSLIRILKMSSSEERVFIIGASGDIGSHVIRGLVRKGVKTTAYVRNEKKTRDLFPEELATGLLSIVVGDYSTMNVYAEAIKGHTRLFILLLADFSKAAQMGNLKGEYGRIAFEQGVRQIVDISSVTLRIAGMQGILGYIHATGEAKLWALAEEDPEKRSVVMLRPAFFMTNHFMGDIRHIKHGNKIISCGPPSAAYSWIDTRGMQKATQIIIINMSLLFEEPLLKMIVVYIADASYL